MLARNAWLAFGGDAPAFLARYGCAGKQCLVTANCERKLVHGASTQTDGLNSPEWQRRVVPCDIVLPHPFGEYFVCNATRP